MQRCATLSTQLSGARENTKIKSPIDFDTEKRHSPSVFNLLDFLFYFLSINFGLPYMPFKVLDSSGSGMQESRRNLGTIRKEIWNNNKKINNLETREEKDKKWKRIWRNDSKNGKNLEKNVHEKRRWEWEKCKEIINERRAQQWWDAAKWRCEKIVANEKKQAAAAILSSNMGVDKVQWVKIETNRCNCEQMQMRTRSLVVRPLIAGNCIRRPEWFVITHLLESVDSIIVYRPHKAVCLVNCTVSSLNEFTDIECLSVYIVQCNYIRSLHWTTKTLERIMEKQSRNNKRCSAPATTRK